MYIVGATLGASGIVWLPLPAWLGGQLSSWLVNALIMLLLAPVWVAVYRFSVLDVTDRGWRQVDLRTRRVALTMLVLSLVSLIGAVPFALGLDVLPQMRAGRRLLLLAVAVAVTVKLAAWWLGARLAIAPAMAATGTNPSALDTSFTYTKGSVFRVLATRLAVHLPLLVIVGGLTQLDREFGPFEMAKGSLIGIVLMLLSASMAAVTDLVDAAVMGRVALRLVRAHRARAAERERRAAADEKGN